MTLRGRIVALCGALVIGGCTRLDTSDGNIHTMIIDVTPSEAGGCHVYVNGSRSITHEDLSISTDSASVISPL